MLDKFPPCKAVDRDWVVAVDREGLVVPVIERLLSENISGDDELIIEVRRKLGDCVPRSAAFRYIEEYAQRGMRISNWSFTGFVVIASNGVATGWKAEVSSSEDA